MDQISNVLTYIVIIVAFIIGYMIVSFVIKHLKHLKDLPPYNKEAWRGETEREGEKENREADYSEHGGEQAWKEWQNKDWKHGWQTNRGEKRSSQQSHSHWERTSTKRTIKDEEYFRSVLGFGHEISFGDIKNRYRELVAQYHPDKVAHLGPKLREAADREIREINEAYDFFKKKYGSS